MKVFEKWKEAFRWKPSEKTKKILITALVALAVCAFFVWLGQGMAFAAAKVGRKEMLPLYIMTAAFPLLTLILSGIRVYRIFREEEPKIPEQDHEKTDD